MPYYAQTIGVGQEYSLGEAMMTEPYGATSNKMMPAMAYGQQPSYFMMSGLKDNMRESYYAAAATARAQQQMFNCGAATLTHSAPNIYGMSNKHRLATNGYYLTNMGAKAPHIANLQRQEMFTQPTTLDESMASTIKCSDDMMRAAFSNADLTLLDSTRLSAILPYSAFATPDEEMLYRVQFAAAYDAATENPDMAALYLATIAAATPNLAKFTQSKTRAFTGLNDAQVNYKGTNVQLSQFLRAPYVSAYVGACVADNTQTSFAGKDNYVANTVGMDVFSPSYAPAFAPYGLTNQVRQATLFGEQLHQ